MGMYAWFTDSEGKKNKTTIAENLDVEVVEPNFPVDGVDDVQPGQTIVKDPAIKNNSDTLTGWLFTEIRVPIAEVKVEGAEVAERLPLFSFDVNSGWVVLQDPFEDGENNEMVYRYGWDATVAPNGGQTGNIFDEVTFVNLDGSAQGLALSEQLVKVIGYGIQDAEQFEGDVTKAWNAYKLQNGIKDGEGNTIAAALIAGAAGNKLQFVQGTPKVGDMLDAGEVIEVVEDVEHLPAQEVSPLVSEENRSSVLTVEDVVLTKPENTVNWFKDMDSVTEIDITGLDTSEVTDKTGMFEGTTNLTKIIVGETTDVADVVPEMFDAIDNTFVPEWENPEKFNVKFIPERHVRPYGHNDTRPSSLDKIGILEFTKQNCSSIAYVNVSDSFLKLKSGEIIKSAQYTDSSFGSTANPNALAKFTSGSLALTAFSDGVYGARSIVDTDIDEVHFVFAFKGVDKNMLFSREFVLKNIVNYDEWFIEPHFYKFDISDITYQFGQFSASLPVSLIGCCSYVFNDVVYNDQYGTFASAEISSLANCSLGLDVTTMSGATGFVVVPLDKMTISYDDFAAASGNARYALVSGSLYDTYPAVAQELDALTNAGADMITSLLVNFYVDVPFMPVYRHPHVNVECSTLGEYRP